MPGVIRFPSLQSPVSAVLAAYGMQNPLPWSAPAYHPDRSHGTVLGRNGGVVYGSHHRFSAGISGDLGLVHGIDVMSGAIATPIREIRLRLEARHDQVNPTNANVFGAGGVNQAIRTPAPGDGLSRPVIRTTTRIPGWGGCGRITGRGNVSPRINHTRWMGQRINARADVARYGGTHDEPNETADRDISQGSR